MLREGSGVFEAIHERADGTLFPVEVSGRLVTGLGGERRVVVVVRDITARRADADRILRLNRMLRTLSSVNELLVRAPEEQHLFEEVCDAQVCRISVEKAGFLAAWIGLARPGDRSRRHRRRGRCPRVSRRPRPPLGRRTARPEGPTGTAIRERANGPRSGDFDDDGRAGQWRDIARQRGFGSCAATPIRRGGEVTGTLTLYSAERGAFDPEIVALVEEMAADIGFSRTSTTARQPPQGASARGRRRRPGSRAEGAGACSSRSSR